MDVYYSCLQHGPDHIRTAPSYFHMGRVFQSYQKKKERTEAFYKKVISNCIGYLEREIQERSADSDISQVEVEEATEIVRHIESYRTKNAGDGAATSPEVLEAQ